MPKLVADRVLRLACNFTHSRLQFTTLHRRNTVYIPVADLEGAEPAPALPLDDGLTPSYTVNGHVS